MDTVVRAKAALPYLKASLPASIKLEIENDRSQTVRASVADVEITPVDLGAAGNPGCLCLLTRDTGHADSGHCGSRLDCGHTFAILWAGGYSLDNLSLMALTISTLEEKGSIVSRVGPR